MGGRDATLQPIPGQTGGKILLPLTLIKVAGLLSEKLY